MAFGPLDETEPMVAGYVARVLALRPAAWDALGRPDAAEPAPELPWLVRALDDACYRVGRGVHAPRQAWRGAGKFRVLAEVLERPYVTGLARSRVLNGLLAVQYRHVLDAGRLDRLYQWVEPAIPWASLPGTSPAAPQHPAG